MRITVNPTVEAQSSFDVVKPTTALLRVKKVEPFDAKSGSQCLRVQFEYVDPTALEKLDGTPATNPGTILDSGFVVSPPEKQGKLRGFVEALGLEWSDFDTEDLVGREVLARIDVEEYEGVQRNVIKRYLPANV